jgi:hypothetical protein
MLLLAILGTGEYGLTTFIIGITPLANFTQTAKAAQANILLVQAAISYTRRFGPKSVHHHLCLKTITDIKS